jgi:SAM-dependent methyltransferase
VSEANENLHAPRVGISANGQLAVSSLGPRRFNFILDDAARRRYAPVIAFLHSLAPELMARKIPAANIQQAFVFDAVRALAPADAKILSVGSFEDTACVALKMVGVAVDEIDPVLNYDLGDFIERPSTGKQSYDVVFATSVIEHVKDDETFMRHLAELLKPNGVMILTCDYNDQYKPGDEIPSVCHRMYTQKDFRERIIPSARQCSPLDDPDWDCPNPDFVLGDRFRYTFATLVLRKSAS